MVFPAERIVLIQAQSLNEWRKGTQEIALVDQAVPVSDVSSHPLLPLFSQDFLFAIHLVDRGRTEKHKQSGDGTPLLEKGHATLQNAEALHRFSSLQQQEISIHQFGCAVPPVNVVLASP